MGIYCLRTLSSGVLLVLWHHLKHLKDDVPSCLWQGQSQTWNHWVMFSSIAGWWIGTQGFVSAKLPYLIGRDRQPFDLWLSGRVHFCWDEALTPSHEVTTSGLIKRTYSNHLMCVVWLTDLSHDGWRGDDGALCHSALHHSPCCCLHYQKRPL